MKTILVVDDLAIFREPITVALTQAGYRALTAANGEQALRITRSERPDLVLLDVYMPDTDGLTFLRCLRRNVETAQIPVLILSESRERRVVEQSARLGVQGYVLKRNFSLTPFLEKVRRLLGELEAPVEGPDTDRRNTAPDVARRSDATSPDHAEPAPLPLATHKRSEVLERVSAKLELRAIPPVLHYVLALANNPSTSIQEIADAIRQDPGLSLRVMKVANSSFYGVGKPVQTLSDAAQRVGVSSIVNTIAAILTIDHFSESGASGLNPQHFWEHGLATAALAERIGRALNVENVEVLFLAGLLHDIGRMLLAEAYPDDVRGIASAAEAEGGDVGALERGVFRIGHDEVTREILRVWKTPAEIVEAAWLHDLTVDQIKQKARNARPALVVALANRVAHALLLGDSGNPLLYPFGAYTQALGLDADTLEPVARETVKQMQDRTLFYASQSDGGFSDPVGRELARVLGSRPRLVTFAKRAGDPACLFCDGLARMDPERANVALLSVDRPSETRRLLSALEEHEKAHRPVAGLLVISHREDPGDVAQFLNARSHELLTLPARYSTLVSRIRKLGQSKVEPREVAESAGPG